MNTRTPATFELDFENDNFILRDHRVYDVRIVPGVTLVDVVYRLGTHFLGHARFELLNVLFKLPIATTDAFSRRVYVTFEERPQGDWTVAVASSKLFADGTVSSDLEENAECILRSADEAPSEAPFDGEAFVRTAERSWPVDEVYRGVRDVGVVHGPFMQTRGDVHQRGDEEVMRLHLGDLAEQYREMFSAHPAFLDGATFAGSSYKLAGTGGYGDDRPHIPFSIRKARLYAPLPSRIYVYSRHADKLASGYESTAREVTSSDVKIYSESGTLLAEFQRLSYKRVRKANDIEKLAPVANAPAPAPAVDDKSVFAANVERIFVEYLSGLSGGGAIELAPTTLFFDAGLDSAHLLQLVRKLEAHCGHDLYPTLLFENPTLNALVDYLYDHERAHFAPKGAAPQPKKKEAPPRAVRPVPSKDVAVIGLAGRYPGASDLDAFWDVVRTGKVCTREVPADHWGRFLPADGVSPAASYGGILDDVDGFDALFFGITPAEADGTDPQLRMLLETSWHAMEDAGYTVESLSKDRVGVYVGVMNDDYTWVAAERLARSGEYTSAGCFGYELANRISYHMNLSGPSMTVEAACASSLLAVHLARAALLNDECDTALAGGVNLSLHRSKYLLLAGLGLMSPDGKERTFDAGANGYVPGEGVGIAVLKTLEKAKADGDRIYGVIAGSATNHSGRGGGRYSPNLNALTEVVEAGMASAGIAPSAIGYVETHGTGTQLGDPIEIQALSKALGRDRAGARPCVLGSKANIGHLESASGICSLTKVLLGTRHGRIPPCANVETVNPGLRLEQTPFVIARDATEWGEPVHQRVAGVHSFGIGGANVFMVVRGHAPESRTQAAATEHPEIVVLSAKTESARRRYCRDLLSYLSKGKLDGTLRDLAHTLQIGRTPLPHRVAFVVRDASELTAALRDYDASGAARAGVFEGKAGAVKPESYDVHDAHRVAELWARGLAIDWAKVGGDRPARRIAAPLYPFEHGASAESMPLPAEPAQAALIHGVPAWREKALPAAARALVNVESNVLVLTAGVSSAVSEAIEANVPLVTLEALPESEGASLAERAMGVFRYALGSIKRALDWRVQEKRQVVILVDGSRPGVVYAPLSGLLKSARLENPRLRAKIVTVHGQAGADRLGGILRDEVLSTDEDIDVRHTADGRREVRVYENIEPAGSARPAVRRGGIYWITGGLGGLGNVFARYLAEAGDVTVVLSGRSGPSEPQRGELARLAASGARIEYLQGDVARQEDVERLVRTIEERYGTLAGIFHCAGVTRDALLVKKTERQADEVFASKALGTQAIDEATRHHRMDFVALFSSVSAIWGNVGQADYAGANGFLDAYAEYRNALVRRGERHGQTVSVNWPLWRDGGMRVDEQGERHLKEKTGMVPLSRGDGLRAFEDALHSGESQWIVCATDGSKPLFLPRRATAGVKTAAPVKSTAQVGQVGQVAQAVRYLKSKLAKVFRLPPDRLDAGAPLEAVGIDSANVLALTRELENDFGVLPKTLFYEYRTLEELARYLAAEHGPALDAIVPRQVVRDLPAPERAPVAQPSAPVPRRGSDGPLDIAIIGMSGRFPLARNLDEFWQNLRSGRDCITEVPASRWDSNRYYDADTSASGKIHSKWGGFIDGVDEFDSLFFKISPLEAEMMDPQERLFLQCAWETLEDAGYTRRALHAAQADAERADARVGVYVGVMYSEYQLQGFEAQDKIFGVPGNLAGVANRVSYFFDFRGPSMALDTMCSSSLTSIYLASQALRNGDCGLALAGGVNVSIHPNKYAVLSQAQFISTNGRCESFGKGGEGYIPGEGVGCVLLKPLERAVAEGDHIYGVIKGAALSHGGKSNGYTVPNPASQASTIALAMRKAGVEPRAISYIEAHGTGTSLGDPIEIAGLVKAFGRDLQDKQFCAIGSAKSNIGHGESAAGIAAVCKVLLQLQHRQIAPSLHSAELNPYIDFAHSPFVVQQELAEWKAPTVGGVTRPRLAGVSSFGAGGSNAHLLIEEYARAPEAERPAHGGPWIVPISARTEERLHVYVEALLSFLLRGAAPELSDVAHTLQIGREAMEHRVAFLAADRADLLDKMKRFLAREPSGAGYWAGRIAPEALAALDDEDVRTAVVTKWIAEQRLDKLGEFWVKGMDLEWPSLGSSGRARRVSLPTYPFQRKRCWISVQRPTAASAPVQAGQGTPLAGTLGGLLTRLVPAASLGDRPKVVFESELRADDRILADHRVRGERMLPGVAYIEMVLEAVRNVHPDRHAVIEDIVWMQPLQVSGDAQTVTTQLEPYASSEPKLQFEIGSTQKGRVQIHARGVVSFGEAGRDLSRVDTAALTRQLTPRWNGNGGREAFYARHRAHGIDYGPYFQGIRSLWGSPTEGLGLVEVPDVAPNDTARYQLPPCLADAALQCVASLSTSEDATGDLFLPYSIGRVEIFSAFERSAFVHVRGSAPGRFDISILGSDGKRLADLRDFSVRPVKDASPSLTYAGKWARQSLLPEATRGEGPFEGRTLIVHRDDGLGLHAAIAAKHAQCTNVRLGDRTEQGGDEWTVDVADPEAFARVVRETPGLQRVYFLPAVVGDQEYRLDGAYVAREQEYTVVAWLRLIRALLDQGYDQAALDVAVVTQDSESLPLQKEIYVGGGALSGLTQSLAKEYPHWRIRNIDISKSDMRGARTIAALASDVLREGANLAGFPVAYRGGVRYEHKVVPLSLPKGPQPAFREGGVYVIVGGAGGIGRVTTEHLLRRYAAKVVWLGRSAMNADIRGHLDRLAGGAGSVEYVSVDISDEARLREVRDALRAKYGRIHGVLHSAIVLRDRSLREMDEARFREALDPKVKGSAALGQVFGKDDLDWLGFYSSMQSFYGAAGQSNYAAGCSFKDTYARALNRVCAFPVFTLNWGYWGSVGIVANESYRQRMASLGIGSLEPDEGMSVLESVIGHEIPQLLAIKLAPVTREKMGIAPYGDDVQANAVGSLFEPVAAATRSGAARRTIDPAQLRGMEDADTCLNEYVVGRLRTAMSSMGPAPAIASKQRLLFEEIQRILQLEPDRGATRGREDVLAKYPDLAAHLALADVCLESLPRILRGEVPATDVIFPNGSTALVEGIYKKNAQADRLNALVADAVEAFVLAKKPGAGKVRILEIGAGTGGTSEGVFERLRGREADVSYVYTDISKSFLLHGRQTYSSMAPYLEFQLFDVERSPSGQGIDKGSFDIVIATNVLHATKNIGNTLRNVKRCLKRNGQLLLNEIGDKRPFTTLTFGLLDGWWVADDREVRIEGSPALSSSQWAQCLAEEGFARIWFSESVSPVAQQHVFVAESDGRAPQEQARPPVANAPPPAPRATAPRPQVPQLRAAAPPDRANLQAYVEETLCKAVAESLKLSEGEFDPSLALSEIGVDSIVAVDLVRRINALLKLALKTTVIFDFPTIRRLAPYLCAEYGTELAQHLEAQNGNGRPAGEDDLMNRLTDDLVNGNISFETTLERLRGTS